MIHVVLGILINNKNQICIAQRKPHQDQGDCWEFPGGKIEHNESPLQALQRELPEELGIQVISASPWQQFNYTYPKKTVLLDVWDVTTFYGNPNGKEGQLVCWIHLEKLTAMIMPAANIPILRQLQDRA